VAWDIPGGDIPPARCLADPYPEFSTVAVDPVHDEVMFGDQNLKSLLVYDRRAGGLSSATTEPLRKVRGPQTGIGFVAGTAVDPVRREFYLVGNDVEDRITVFSKGANGNALPVRLLYTPHQAWGIALDQSRNELVITTEELNAIFFYRKEAKGLEAPLRMIRGGKTEMADPHGIALAERQGEIFVANHGNYHQEEDSYRYTKEFGGLLSSSGSFQPASITIYSKNASGDQAPLRKISGERTGLNWPMGLAYDETADEIVVANNGDNSILFFRRNANGDVAATRVLRGSETELAQPVGVFVDSKNHELWVSNFGNHSATVYDLGAKGNAKPMRIIRNAPKGSPTTGLANVGALAYNPGRDELFVAN
jgi:DNA-binding beta-propeller fold protein YncE